MRHDDARQAYAGRMGVHYATMSQFNEVRVVFLDDSIGTYYQHKPSRPKGDVIAQSGRIWL